MSQSTGRLELAGGVATALVVLAVIPAECQAQARRPPLEPEPQGENLTSPFKGCYELRLGRWWPWGMGEDTIYATPPSRVKLLPEKRTEGFETNGYIIRAMTPEKGAAPARGGSSYWQLKSGAQVDLVWTDGFTGVTLRLKKHGDKLTGWAHPHFDRTLFVPHIVHVTARRISCE